MKRLFTPIILLVCACAIYAAGAAAPTELASRTFNGSAGGPLSGKIIYLNPGHGSWGPNDRPCATIPYPNLPSTGRPDTCGFYESNTDLWKMEELRDRLVAAGAKVIMSRIGNGPFPYVSGASNATAYNRNLSEICEEVEDQLKNKGGVSMFFSLHSNATGDGTTTNYPLMIYRGTDALDYVKNSRSMAEAVWDEHVEYMYANGFEYQSLFTQSRYVKGDITFYGSSSNRYSNTSHIYYNGYLGVLKHGAPGFLSEGFFHTYQPARHRALNRDFCRQEGLRAYRGIINYFKVTDNTNAATKGCIMGAVKDKNLNVDHKLYTYKSGTPDAYWPVLGAVVQLRSVTNPTVVIARDTTDDNMNGIFTFWDLTPGEYFLDVKAQGYATVNGSNTNNCITTYHNGYANSNSTTTYMVTVRGGETVYPYVYMTYGESTEFTNAQDPEPPVVEPDKEYDLQLKYEGTISQLEGKTIRRAIYRDGYLYVLALGTSNVPYVYKINTADTEEVYSYSITGCSANGFGTYQDVLRISDIALTSDGVLIGCNKELVGYGEAGDPTNYWKVYKWTDVLSDPVVWIQGRYTYYSGNNGRGYTGETMSYQGSSTSGYLVTTAERASDTYNLRYVYCQIQNGVVSSYAFNLLGPDSGLSNEVKLASYGGHVTLNAMPNNNRFMMDGDAISPYEWTPSSTPRAQITYNSTLPTTLSNVAANGGTWFSMGAKRMMAYPTNSSAGMNTGVQVLDITSGLASAKQLPTGAATTLSATPYSYEMAAGDFRDTVLTLYLLRDNNLYIWDNYVAPVIPTIPVTAILLDKGNIRLSRGATETLTATVLPDDATNKNYTWSSDNEAVATVSQQGLVTAVSTGTATITATTEDGGKTAICRVTVYTPIERLMVTPTPVNVPGIGHTVQLVAKVLPVDADDQAVTWTTGNAARATVNETGIVTGGIPGAVTITCTANENHEIHASAAVNVQMAGRYTVGTEGQNYAALKTAISDFETTQSAAPSNLVGDVTLAIATDLDEAATGLWNTSNYSLTIEPEANTSPTVTYKTSGSAVLAGGLVIGSSTPGNTSRVSKEAKFITINGTSDNDGQRQMKFIWAGTTNNLNEGAIELYGNTHDCTIENLEIFNNKQQSAGTSYAYGLLIRSEQNDKSGARPHDILVRNNHIESFVHPSGQSIYISGDYATGKETVAEGSSPYNITIADNELVATTRGIFVEGGSAITVEGNTFDIKQIVYSGYLSHGFYSNYSWGTVDIRKNRFYRLHTINTHNMTDTDPDKRRFGIHGITAQGRATFNIENNYITGLNSLMPNSSSFNVIGIWVGELATAKIRYNTIVMPNLNYYPKNSLTTYGKTACIYLEAQNTIIQNNILASHESHSVPSAIIYSTYTPTSSNANNWDYNVFDYGGEVRVWGTRYKSDGSYAARGNKDFGPATKAETYQSRGIGDAHSIKTNVTFANIAECDLALVGEDAELALLTVANPIPGITTDIVGTKRSETTPYAGAYEVFVWEDGDEVDVVDFSEQWLVINLNSMTGMTDYSIAPRVEINGLPAAVEVLDNEKHQGTPLRTYRVTPVEPLVENDTYTINVIAGGQSIAKHAYKVPVVVSTDMTMSSLPATADVLVRDGATLTISGTIDAHRVAVNAGSKLVIPNGATLNADSLYLRSRYDEVAELVDEGTLRVTTLFLTKMLADKDRYYFLSVPYNVANANVGLYLTNGLRLKYNSSYRLKYYDGAARASHGLNEANWTGVGPTLEPMTGYEMLTSANNYREYLFPMTYTPLTDEQHTAVSSYTLGSGIHPINGGWNWIAHPFMDTYRGAVTYTAPASDYYEDMYLTMYGTDGTYYQEYSGFGDVEIPPFTPVFVQVKQEDPSAPSEGRVTFNRPAYSSPIQQRAACDSTIPRFNSPQGSSTVRRAGEQPDSTIWTRLTLSSAATSDKAGILIHPRHTAEYEVNRDLQKWYTAGARVQIYGIAYEDRMAFTAMSDAAAGNGLPLGYYAPEAGTMTLRYDAQQDDLARVQAVYLWDGQTGQEVEITEQAYTFTTSAGECNNRFRIRYELVPLSIDQGGITTGINSTGTTYLFNSEAFNDSTTLYDLLGRPVSEPTEHGVYVLFNAATGTATKIEL